MNKAGKTAFLFLILRSKKMYEITLKQGGVDKVFKKDYINVEDNLSAVEHQVRQSPSYDASAHDLVGGIQRATPQHRALSCLNNP